MNFERYKKHMTVSYWAMVRSIQIGDDTGAAFYGRLLARTGLLVMSLKPEIYSYREV